MSILQLTGKIFTFTILSISLDLKAQYLHIVCQIKAGKLIFQTDSSVGSTFSAELRVRILPDKLELSQLKAILKIAFLLFLLKLSYYSF